MLNNLSEDRRAGPLQRRWRDILQNYSESTEHGPPSEGATQLPCANNCNGLIFHGWTDSTGSLAFVSRDLTKDLFVATKDDFVPGNHDRAANQVGSFRHQHDRFGARRWAL
jgi:hypothetical protein